MSNDKENTYHGRSLDCVFCPHNGDTDSDTDTDTDTDADTDTDGELIAEAIDGAATFIGKCIVLGFRELAAAIKENRHE